MRRSQIAMEYIVIVGLAFMILIPGMYLFRRYAEDASDKITEKKIYSVAHELLTAAEEVYHYGPPAKKVVEVEMPEGVENIAVYYDDAGTPEPDDDECNLIIVADSESGKQNFIFNSEVPLMLFEDVGWDCGGQYGNGDSLILSGDVDCDEDAFEENFYTLYGFYITNCFLPKDYSSGPKKYRIEAISGSIEDYSGVPHDCPSGAGNSCVIIDEVSNELSCG